MAASIPSLAAITNSAQSAARSPARSSPTKSAYPGVSTRLTFTPSRTSGATASEMDRSWACSASSKSHTVVPSRTDPARRMAPAEASSVSTRVVLPDPPGPTRTTLRIRSGLLASRSCPAGLRALPFSAMSRGNSCAAQKTRACRRPQTSCPANRDSTSAGPGASTFVGGARTTPGSGPPSARSVGGGSDTTRSPDESQNAARVRSGSGSCPRHRPVGRPRDRPGQPLPAGGVRRVPGGRAASTRKARTRHRMGSTAGPAHPEAINPPGRTRVSLRHPPRQPFPEIGDVAGCGHDKFCRARRPGRRDFVTAGRPGAVARGREREAVRRDRPRGRLRPHRRWPTPTSGDALDALDAAVAAQADWAATAAARARGDPAPCLRADHRAAPTTSRG